MRPIKQAFLECILLTYVRFAFTFVFELLCVVLANSISLITTTKHSKSPLTAMASNKASCSRTVHLSI